MTISNSGGALHVITTSPSGVGYFNSASCLVLSTGFCVPLSQVAAGLAGTLESLTVTTPSAQAAGVAFTQPGTYSGGTPAALDYSLDGGLTWGPVTSPTIGSGAFSFPLTIASANAAQTVAVRDHATYVGNISSAFAVTAGSTLTSWVVSANGTTNTATFNQAVTCTAADFSITNGGTADTLTNSDCGSSSTTHTFTASTAILSGAAVLVSATPTGATSPALAATISARSATNNSTQTAPTTVSSAVVASNGTTLTFTFNQAVTITAADFTITQGGTADSLTNTDAATSSTAHVFTAATVINSGVAVLYSITPTTATSPALGATVSGATATNNSTQGSGTVGPAMTMSSPTYNTSLPKFGSAALSGGSGTTASAISLSGDRTFECWFNSTGSAPGGYNPLFVDQNNYGLLAAANNLYMQWPGGNTQPGINIYTGSYIHIAETFNNTTHVATLWVNGSSVATSSTWTASLPTTETMTASPQSNGLLDECAVFNYQKYTTTFTPSSAPYTSGTSGIVGGWHFDSSGASD